MDDLGVGWRRAGARREATCPLTKLPNAAVAKASKVSGKKNKATDGSSKRPKKRLAGRAMHAAGTEAPASSLVPPATDAHKVFDEMPTSFNDEAYMSTFGVGSNNSHWFQTNDVHFDDHEFEVDKDGEGIINAPKGRASNYTMDEDIFLCNTWLQVSRNATVGGDQNRDAYWIRMKEHFVLHNKSGIDRMERSLRSRWSTINKDCQSSLLHKTYFKERRRRSRKEANEVRKIARNEDAVVEERRLAAEERRVVAEERKVALEEKKLAMKERTRLLEWEKYLFFMDTSTLDEK
ncbi:putative receptor protein kinase ZmPK1 [Hordeum vulgare]|nr:putative receptor protein kinase ZmPK1 [Hordeum vulgare]